MKNKTVLFVCQFFYPEKISSGILPFELAGELSKLGYNVKALVGYPKEYCDEKTINKQETINGINIKRIKYATFNRNNVIGRVLNYFTFCFSVIASFSSFRNIDICISYTNPPLLPPIIGWFSKKFHFRYIFEIYDLYPDAAIKTGMLSSAGIIAKIFDKGTNYALDKAWKVIALSGECKEYIIKNKKINQNKISVIPNWYSPQELKTKDAIKEKMTIVYGGNMGIMQDMDTVKDLLISMKDDMRFQFVFAGHGNKKDIISNAVKKYSIKNCKLYDFLPKKDYDQLLNQADMAIVSLQKFSVGLGAPSKIYSYLAKGLPVIAIIDKDTDIVKDMQEYNYGTNCENGDYKTLKLKLNELIEHKEKLAAMGQNAYRLFRDKYTLEKAVEDFSTLIMEENYEQ